MILILSNHGDYTTDVVLDMLTGYEGGVYRINSFDFLNEPLSFKLGPNSIKLGDQIIDPSLVGAVWFRKFGFFRKSVQAKALQSCLDAQMQSHLATEFARVLEAFEMCFPSAFWLTNPRKVFINKYSVLSAARVIGLEIPNTYIVNNLTDLKTILKLEKRLISKSIYDPIIVKYKGENYTTYTTEIDDNILQKLPLHFLPSLVQQAIEKSYEVRTFYLDGRCYSMAIMSQSDEQTSIDYRRYNIEKPNRFVPYSLPQDIEIKLTVLMEKIGLNTGSVDFIVDKQGRHIFLEVNPTGQFGMVDFSCCYDLHRKVAQLLVEKDRLHIQ